MNGYVFKQAAEVLVKKQRSNGKEPGPIVDKLRQAHDGTDSEATQGRIERLLEILTDSPANRSLEW
ncbi:MAG: hypothetical protein ACQESR_21065 [Planctomycetota bacterium]